MAALLAAIARAGALNVSFLRFYYECCLSGHDSETAATICGRKVALERDVVKEKKPLQGVVAIFDREW